MSISPQLQAHYDRLKARKADPDGDVHPGGWVRIRALRCPICKGVFFGWQKEGETFDPYTIETDPTPPTSRETCGHPICHKAESEYQLRRRMESRKVPVVVPVSPSTQSGARP